MQLTLAETERLIASLAATELGRVMDQPSLSAPPPTLNEIALATSHAQQRQLAEAVIEMFHLYETGMDEPLLRAESLTDWPLVVMESRAENGERFSFLSRTPAGRRVLHMHAWESLAQEAREWAALLEGCRRVVLTLPCHTPSGLVFGVLLPRLQRTSVMDWEQSSSFSRGDMLVARAVWLAHFASATPLQGVHVVALDAPLNTKLARRLRSQQASSVLEVFGSAEAGALAYRFHYAEPFELLPYCRHEDGELRRLLPSGGQQLIELPQPVQWTDARTFHASAHFAADDSTVLAEVTT